MHATRTCIAGAFAVVVIAAGTPPALAHSGASKFDLVGPRGVVSCETMMPFEGDDSDQRAGTVLFNHVDGMVSASVAMRGVIPNAQYRVRIIQGSHDCATDDGVLVTDHLGNGTLRLLEPDTGDLAQVQIIYSLLATRFGPFYRASEGFWTD